VNEKMKEQVNDVIKLPEWKHCLKKLRKRGINYGESYPTEFFEKHLRKERDTLEFGMDMYQIRKELEKEGYYLSGRGQKGKQYVILDAGSNVNIMKNYQRQALRSLKRGVILGTNTSMDVLDENEKDKHKRVLETMAIKTVLLSRKNETLGFDSLKKLKYKLD
jgi:transketolase